MSAPTVLLVDDLPESRKEIQEALQRLGYQVSGGVPSLEQLPERVKDQEPSLVLAHIRLVDRPSHIQVLQEVYESGTAPVVMLTDHVDHEVALRMQQAGVFGYVILPVVDEQLSSTLDLVLRGFAYRQEKVQTRKLLDAILHTAHEGFFILEGKTKRFLECNDAYCRMLGFTREELLAKTLFDIEADDTPEDILENERQLIESGSLRIRRRHRTQSGPLREVEQNIRVFEEKTGPVYCVFCRDLTESLAQEKLMRLQTNALAAAANAVVITDAEGLVVWVNRAFSQFTGYTPEEVVGREPGDLLRSGEHDDAFYSDMWQTIQRGEVWSNEIVNKRKDGSLYTEDMTITPLFDDRGVVTNYIAIKQDISKSKELEKMLHRAQRLESIGTLASGVAHDLNNVLSPVMMSADLMLMQETDEQKRETIQMMKDGAMRGADIIRQLLSFARGGDSPFASVNLSPLAKELCKVFKETFPKNITIGFHLENAPWPIRGDATQMHQVLTNLMINARDAMPEGGSLDVTLGNVHVGGEGLMLHPSSQPGDYVRVRIEDSGTGIPEEIRERIFDPFFTTKSLGKGTGLGLSTVLGIVKAHKGFLTCEEREGGGTRFDIFLPRERGGRAGETASEASSLPRLGQGERILVVDDEEAIRNMLKGTLESLNYQVVTACNGREALEKMQEPGFKVDLILLDFMMPEMDGRVFLSALPKDLLGETRIVLISGILETIDLEVFGNSIAYLPKPFSIDSLAKVLRAQLDS